MPLRPQPPHRATLARLVAAGVLILAPAIARAGPLDDAAAAYTRSDFATALALLQPLAASGDGTAEYRLGLLYADGQGVPRDPLLAYMWWTFADLNGDPDAVFARDDIEAGMTPADLARAEQLAAAGEPAPPVY